jgi:uncharacterized protein (DUF1697 family)
MARYVGLLRGINVGGHKKVPMAQLREALSGIGWTDVRTYLQSGNVVFTVPGGPHTDTEVRAALEGAIAERFGFEVPTLVRTGTELEAVAAACPYPADALDPATLLVVFLEHDPGEGYYDGIDEAAFAPDTFRHLGEAVYCHFPHGMGRSKLGAALGAVRPRVPATGRNWRTVTKLMELTREE